MKKSTKKGIVWGSILLVLAVSGIVFGMVGKYYYGTAYYGTATGRDAIIYVPTGSSYARLMDTLETHLNDPAAFDRLAKSKHLDRSVRPGRYALKAGMTYKEVINILASGRQAPVNVTINNIRTLNRLAGTVAKKIEADSLALWTALQDTRLRDSLGYDAENYIGMFLPNTYQLYWTTTPEQFILRMKRESDRFWNEDRQSKLTARGLSREQALTLASIVYEETKLAAEMPRVAGVYLNRLKIGMPLQADPTVKFAMGDFTIKRVLNRHLTTDSPYNTYMYAGIPPGPISMPSIDAIEAVLNPEEHDYYYFCAKADFSGAHAFAKDLSEHNRNSREYSAALDRLGIR